MRARASSVIQVTPPSSDTALEYLNKFCFRYRLHGQCSAARATALYIPPHSGQSACLPSPRQLQSRPSPQGSESSNLVADYGKTFNYYMTLSCNVLGMRSLLHSTFFNPEIECNLVSAWLNRAFAIINPLTEEEQHSKLVRLLARRQPRSGCLWLGAVLMGIAKSTLRDIRIGLTAIELNAAAWTGIEQSFITAKLFSCDGALVRREDECRLLFMTKSDGHGRPPIEPWKPFGETRIGDTELGVRQHIRCGCHWLTYESWTWHLVNGEVFKDCGISTASAPDEAEAVQSEESSHCHWESCSQSASETATRGIFEWLRSTGYPAAERSVYQHSWIDLESSDEEDDAGSDVVKEIQSHAGVREWVSGLDLYPGL